MSEQIAPEAAEGLGFVGGFAPAPLLVEDEPATPESESPAEPEAKVEPEAAKPEPKESLAEVIRKQREDRAAREAKEKEAASAREEATTLKSEVEKLKRSLSEFEADPIGYARAAKWTKERQAYIGQMLLYDLAPDKATPEVRQALFESRQALREKEAAQRAEAERAEKAKQADQAEYQNYVAMVHQAVDGFEAGSYPESESWFGEDRDTYEQSLLVTARNLSIAAKQAGKMADLSPGNLARTLEQEIARRMAKRDERRGGRQAQPKAGSPASGKQPMDDSTKGLTQSGTPRPKALTDAERIARAAEAAFRKPGGR